MIHILEQSLINKIAAGEVIENPASVVKELLENAFDAQATDIKIKVKDAGLKKIKITDNGHGMSEQDALMCFKRHATSKIQDENDLFNIHSLGFRGEALAAISEVAHVILRTKTAEENLGIEIELEAGKILNKKQIASTTGTSITINDLFYNVPVRKRYLSSKENEYAKILNIVTRYALARKDVSCTFMNEEKIVFTMPKTNTLKETIIHLQGSEIAKNLVEIQHETEGITLEGFISKPNLTRATKTDQSLYINNRYVRSDQITSFIYEAMKTLLFTGRHPLFFLMIKIDPKDIDVNVHPQKQTIRIKNEQAIEKAIKEGIQKAFQKENLIPEENLPQRFSVGHKSTYFRTGEQQTLSVEEKIVEKKGIQETFPKKEEEQKETIFGAYNLLGQAHKSFIILENKDGILIIDQHAAEERVNYEKFMRQLKENAIKKQTLVEAKIFELSPYLFEITKQQKVFLEKIGFHYEEFGQHTIKLIAIPEIFGRLKSTLFLDVINQLSKLKGEVLTKEIEDRIIRFACRASVKAGDELTRPQITELVNKVEQCENPFTCPHGRPTMFKLTLYELEKKFKRTGW